MLFNSYIFIFLFLPIVLFVFYQVGERGHHRIAISWLVGASLFFYAWWNPAYLGLILFSIFFNYTIGVALKGGSTKGRKRILGFGILGNLGLIGYFKYANFFVDSINYALGSTFHLETIILPLAVSFFTFQQIAYLVDAYKGETKEYNFLHYCLFVSFFPQLIAGPIVHHKEMLPQFAKDLVYRLNHKNIAVGLTIFTLGLFKKVVLADGVAVYASPVFDAAEQDIALTLFEAWGGALAYSLQLYFDFSGYSDMAIGLARMFGIILPLNFNSPYKAKNIIEFWRDWHITLSRFLRDYVYIPLGGNRKGKTRRYINLMITMLLGGLWHGAGWTFIIWGALHGFYLIVNHTWHAAMRYLGQDTNKATWFGVFFGRLITFIAVVIAWVFFRAESLNGGTNILMAMFGNNGISLPVAFEISLGTSFPWIKDYGVMFDGMFHNRIGSGWRAGMELIAMLLLIAWFAPNTQQFMSDFGPASWNTRNKQPCRPNYLKWKPSLTHAIATFIVLFVAITHITKASEFLYFNF